ncbi:MAG TPA: right-handed parallel beta-helix repeat-containing protein [Thermoanaerobaculia bacterium]|nr:right-handed parallel beta-helix repeat-containing protein [Thermoanaerobaculia bacterium]
MGISESSRTPLWLASLLLVLLPALASAATITVNNPGNAVASDGVCTLHEAITAANTNTASGGMAGECAAGDAGSTVDEIGFNITGGCVTVCTITPEAALPSITGRVHINGYSQAGSSANTLAVGNDAVFKIELNGTISPNGLHLAAGSANSTIRGLVINRFQSGITVESVSNVIRGNFIGIDPTGTIVHPGIQVRGILIQSAGNLIGVNPGFPNLADRNVISGSNIGAGILLNGAGATGNTIAGNYIGTSAAGSAAIPNPVGIDIRSGSGNTIGGSAAGGGNVISGNRSLGVYISGSNNNTVQGNSIGTNAAGTSALGNGGGVQVDNGTGNLIGKREAAAAGGGNVISANTDVGIRLQSASNTTVQGNIIGMNATATAALGNLDGGVRVFGGSGNLIRSNVIFSNQGSLNPPSLGIDLEADGVTPNDAGDADTGSNDLQNFPVLTTASFAGGNTTISGTLSSTPNTSFTLEFFVNSACDASGFGEGQRPIGTAPVTTDGSGNVSFGPLVFATANSLPFATATATNPTSSTSEFSACVEVDGVIAGLSLHTIAPCRIADTRDPVGPSGGPELTAGASRSFPVAGLCNVPPGAKAVVVNVTVVGPSSGGHLTLYPAGGSLPLASTINFRAGQVRANNAVLLLGSGGQVAVFAGNPSGTTHFVMDVNGYFE